MPEITVDGRKIEVAPGKKLLEVLVAEGVEVPYYCWHPDLKPAGNCRMCLVKVSNSRKLEVSCMWPCADGMTVETKGPEVDAGRKAVLEYMLINHPLDCPICDKAGECMLQDHTYNYRHGLSRFHEDKVIKGTWELGPNIKIWGNRCISCTRCVRFCDEVAGTSELSIVNRGDHSVADVHPEVPLDNPMSLCTVDICPVGALIDKNFLYQARVWFAERKETVCAGCSHGCNVTATVYKGEVKRLQPRRNEAVNGPWMCDEGRLDLKWITSPDRLQSPKGSSGELGAALKAQSKLAILVSTSNTNEELYLVQQLAEAVGARVGFLGRTGARWESKSGFVIEADRTANTAGAEHRFGALPTEDDITLAIEKGEVTGLLYINAIPGRPVSARLQGAARGLSFLAVSDVMTNALVSQASFVVPSAGWAEKDGTFTNRDGRIQRIHALVTPHGDIRPEVAWLQDLLVQLGVRRATLSVEGVFREAYPGLDYRKVGDQGVVPDEAVAAAEPAPTGPVVEAK